MPFGSYVDSRLLNRDGSFSQYRGYGYGSQLGFAIYRNTDFKISILGEYLKSTTTSSYDSGLKMDREETSAGLQIDFFSRLQLNVAYGQASNKTQSSGIETGFSHSFTSMGLGLRIFNISEEMSLNALCWYKSGFASRSNSDLATNSGYEGLNVTLGLVWSPPMVIFSKK